MVCKGQHYSPVSELPICILLVGNKHMDIPFPALPTWADKMDLTNVCILRGYTSKVGSDRLLGKPSLLGGVLCGPVHFKY